MQRDQGPHRGPDYSEREHIFSDLEELYWRSQHMLASRRFAFEDVRQLSVSITHVRTLLTELAEIEGRMPGSGLHTIAAIRSLKDRYWELEGMVKEARNNLEQTDYRQI